MTENFDDIRPYTNEEAPAVFRHLMEDKRFQVSLARCLPHYTIENLRKDVVDFHSIDEMQASFDKRFMDVFLRQFSTGQTLSGVENLEPDKAYLFIANHRDITFDAAMLQYYFFISGRKASKIAVGENLYVTPLLGDIARLNKMFLVKRSGTLREKLINFKHLSAYIQYSLFDEKESVWIAQRDGRTKDGDDYTKQGLIKMVSMGHDKNLIETLKRMNITPVTISYEYEPCAGFKARELSLSEKQHYRKRDGEDFESIKQGIFTQKGHISLVIGKTLQEELDKIPEEYSNNDKLLSVCQLIDHQIYRDYRLYANNYIANDLMHNTMHYTAHYTPEQKEQFLHYLRQQAVVSDVPEEKMMGYLLKIYGTPVDNHHHKPVNRKR